MTLGVLAFALAVAGGTVLASPRCRPRNMEGYAWRCSWRWRRFRCQPLSPGLSLILIFSFWLHWLPVGGWGSPSAVVLPAITLRSSLMWPTSRDLLRGSMMETLGQDFIRTARAKGLAERLVLYRHALRVAILPVVSFLGPSGGTFADRLDRCRDHLLHSGRRWIFVNSILNRDGISSWRSGHRLLHDARALQSRGGRHLHLASTEGSASMLDQRAVGKVLEKSCSPRLGGNTPW